MIKVQLKRIYKFNVGYNTKNKVHMNFYFYMPELSEIFGR